MPNVERFEKISYYKNVIDDPQFLINLIEDSDKNLTKDTLRIRYKHKKIYKNLQKQLMLL